jgi:polyhydroxyalkanoate synthesis repressor PhaR
MSDQDKQGAGQKHLDIRKYPNRRYYDTTHSRHLTLEEIRDLVRDGYDIKVEDSKSGADITPQVLTQIILELETPKLEAFPSAMLVQMIRANERAVGDFIQKYFTQAFSAYLDYQKQMEERLRHLQTLPSALNPFTAFGPGMFNPFAPPANTATTPPAKTAKPAAPDEDMRELISQLQAQVAGLQQELKKKPRKKRR